MDECLWEIDLIPGSNIFKLFQFCSVQLLSHVRLFATPWITALQASQSITNSQSSPRLTSIESVMPSSQAPLSIAFPRREYWNGLTFLSPGHLPDPGIEPVSPIWQVYSLPLSHLRSLKPTVVEYLYHRNRQWKNQSFYVSESWCVLKAYLGSLAWDKQPENMLHGMT